MVSAKRVVLKNYVTGPINPDSDFATETFDFDVESTDLNDGGIIIKTTYLSVDPYMRGRLNPGGSGVLGSATLGSPFGGHGIGTVLKSKNSQYKEGQTVTGFFSWATHQVIADPAQSQCHAVAFPQGVPETFAISMLGMPGMTAYKGLKHVCEPKQGETLFVSAAAGAVGQIVCQLGKLWGLKVVACAGSKEKCEMLEKDCGVDVAFNYKEYPSYEEFLKKLRNVCPNGIDCYYENVGGIILDAVLMVANAGARIGVCGLVSQYDKMSQGQAYGVKNLSCIIYKQIKLQGFVVNSLCEKYGIQDAIQDMSDAYLQKKLTYKEDICETDISQTPHVLLKMLQGKNVGKQIVKLTN